MRNRRRRAAISCQVVAVVLLTASAGAQGVAGLPESRFLIQHETLPREGSQPLQVTYLTARELPARTQRLMETTRATVALLHEWFGALPSTALTVAGIPWRVPAGVSAGVVSVPVRWLAPVRDQSMDRALITGLVRQYWPQSLSPGVSDFTEAIAVYTASRAVHHQLEVRNFAVSRFFGGFVPFPLRSLLLSPPVNDPNPRVVGFEALENPEGRAELRGVRALQSLERYVGWPTMLDALAQLRERPQEEIDAAAFADVLSRLRGTDVRFLVEELFRADLEFDYALTDLQTRPVNGGVETSVEISRRGSGRFALSDQEGDARPALPIRVRFADGRELLDRIDGAPATVSLVYTAPAEAVSAAVDPDVILVLDVNRENNVRILEPRLSKLGVRLALHWLAWLQNAMLSYSALV